MIKNFPGEHWSSKKAVFDQILTEETMLRSQGEVYLSRLAWLIVFALYHL